MKKIDYGCRKPSVALPVRCLMHGKSDEQPILFTPEQPPTDLSGIWSKQKTHVGIDRHPATEIRIGAEVDMSRSTLSSAPGPIAPPAAADASTFGLGGRL
jgi:hypothetical protein